MAFEREWLDHDYYSVLGVNKTATAKEITTQYRKLAKAHHPDTKGTTGDDTRFKEISAAYDILGDEAKRADYDEARRIGKHAPPGYGVPPDNGFPSGAYDYDPSEFDLSDLIGNLGFGATSRRKESPGLDLRAELVLDFKDVALGVTQTLTITTNTTCSACAGNRCQQGYSPQRCDTCSGTGITGGGGLFSLHRPCRTCGGLGEIITAPCLLCQAAGLVNTTDEVTVRIPAGVAQGGQIRVPAHGALNTPNGPRGDLYVEVHARPDLKFGRTGNNLTTNVSISFTDAALGIKLKVDTLDKPVTLKIPPGTQSSKTFRVKGRGIKPRSRPSGDLLVTVIVDVPTSIDPAQRAALESLSKLLTTPPHQAAP
jgi:molecular chaperone DnaJ